ncbi:MAG TPA: hypothetical protein VIY48_11700 [Candidatus Paceibacterota bacterium]
MKLHHGIALIASVKGTGESALTEAYAKSQKTPMLMGYQKTYSPRDEEGEKLPSEGNLLQLTVPEIMSAVVDPMSELLNLVATVDSGNQIATADVVDSDTGEIIMQNVPVSTLIYLEKKLVDFATFVSKLPVLDAAETWVDGDDGLSFKTVPSTKVRTKKVPRVLEKAPATDKHAAQVEVWYEDIVVGDWTTVNLSGAITQKRKRELANKVMKLSRAIKIARENANSTEIMKKEIAPAFFKALGWTE